MPTLSIVIPAYNEEDGIDTILRRTHEAAASLTRADERLPDVEVLVVDDGSSDRTAERVRAWPGTRLVSHSRNRGYGAALKTGFLEARGDLVGFLDADGTYPPESFRALCGPILDGNADVTVGTRSRTEDSGMPLLRRIGNSFFAALLSWIAETPTADSASGMRVFRRADLPRLLPLPDGLDFIVGFATRTLHENLRIVEIPIPYAERSGRSKLNVLRDGLRFLRTFVATGATYNPLKFFGTAAVVLLLLALWLGIGPVRYYLVHRRVEDWEIYRLSTILVLGMAGLGLINYGILGNRLLAIASGKPVEKRGLLGRLFLSRSFGNLSWKLGVLLCTAAVVLNARTIGQYLRLRAISVHWSFIITGATLFLVGAQLLMSGGLAWVFRKFEERQAYLRRLGTGGARFPAEDSSPPGAAPGSAARGSP